MAVRVLVVDADSDIRRLEQRILQRHGYEVVTAADDADALAAIAQAPLDLLLTDPPLLRRHRADVDALRAARGQSRFAILVSDRADGTPVDVPALRRPFGVDDLVRAVSAMLSGGDPAASLGSNLH
jgi:DNA-binding response OmpR family regulator